MNIKSAIYTFAAMLIFCLILVQGAAAEDMYFFVDKWGSYVHGDGDIIPLFQ